MPTTANERIKKFREKQKTLGRKLRHFYLTNKEDEQVKKRVLELRENENEQP